MLVVGHSEHPCPHSLPSRTRDVNFVQSVCKANDCMPVSRSPVLSPPSGLPSCPSFCPGLRWRISWWHSMGQSGPISAPHAVAFSSRRAQRWLSGEKGRLRIHLEPLATAWPSFLSPDVDGAAVMPVHQGYAEQPSAWLWIKRHPVVRTAPQPTMRSLLPPSERVCH